MNFKKVFVSPLQRTRQTRELAGFGDMAEIGPDPVEWDFGQYEGRRSVDIRTERPGKRRRRG
jgi:broad specificity phosphatase PhoE